MTGKRIWELDFIRGLAMLLMIVLHTIISMRSFFGYNINVNEDVFDLLLYITRVLFITVAGISSTFSRNNLKRGVKLIAFGMLITLVTFLYDKRYLVQFGILHFIGVSSILYSLYRNVNRIILLIAACIMLYLGFSVFPEMKTEIGFLFPIGLTTASFSSGDYFPLIPWLGLFIIGNIIGVYIYKSRKSIIHKEIKENFINMVGRKTLYIYVLHQPVIFLVLTLISLI